MIVGVVAAAVSIIVVQVFAAPLYYGWTAPSKMGQGSGHMNYGNGCSMNGHSMMSGYSMNHQQCEQRMGTNGVHMMNGQYDQQQCQQHMGGNEMTPGQCQAMY